VKDWQRWFLCVWFASVEQLCGPFNPVTESVIAVGVCLVSAEFLRACCFTVPVNSREEREVDHIIKRISREVRIEVRRIQMITMNDDGH